MFFRHLGVLHANSWSYVVKPRRFRVTDKQTDIRQTKKRTDRQCKASCLSDKNKWETLICENFRFWCSSLNNLESRFTMKNNTLKKKLLEIYWIKECHCALRTFSVLPFCYFINNYKLTLSGSTCIEKKVKDKKLKYLSCVLRANHNDHYIHQC